MAEFEAKHRNLDKLLAWLEKSKDGSKEERDTDEVQEVDSGGEKIEVKKENVPSNTESQRLSTAAMVKVLMASE